jgi:hypothetical protein
MTFVFVIRNDNANADVNISTHMKTEAYYLDVDDVEDELFVVSVVEFLQVPGNIT